MFTEGKLQQRAVTASEVAQGTWQATVVISSIGRPCALSVRAQYDGNGLGNGLRQSNQANITSLYPDRLSSPMALPLPGPGRVRLILWRFSSNSFAPSRPQRSSGWGLRTVRKPRSPGVLAMGRVRWPIMTPSTVTLRDSAGPRAAAF